MRFAIITDIHEDIESLVAAFKQIEKLACDEIISLGDICGFSIPYYYKYYNTRNASECVKLVKANCKYSVIGNHDLYAIKKLPENIFSFDFPGDWYDITYYDRKNISNQKIWLYEENELTALLDSDDIEYLNKLPEMSCIETDELNLFISHYLYPDITGSTTDFLFESSDFIKHHSFIKKNNSNICTFGHMHPNGILRINNKGMTADKKQITNTDKIYGFSGPCITQNGRLNGFIVFDTKEKTITPHFLRKFKPDSLF